jgi:hypothetical protein
MEEFKVRNEEYIQKSAEQTITLTRRIWILINILSKSDIEPRRKLDMDATRQTSLESFGVNPKIEFQT